MNNWANQKFKNMTKKIQWQITAGRFCVSHLFLFKTNPSDGIIDVENVKKFFFEFHYFTFHMLSHRCLWIKHWCPLCPILIRRLHEEERTLQAIESAKPKDATGEHACSNGPTGQASLEEGEKLPLHEAEPKPCDDGKTLIERMFGGRLITGIRCTQCNSISEKEEPFTDLSLAFCPATSQNVPQPEGPSKEPAVSSQGCVNGGSETLEPGSARSPASSVPSVPMTNEPPLSVPDLVNYFLAPETLDEDNAYYCEKCNSLQRAEKTLKLVSAPEYLILTLLRFSYDAKCHVRRKILDNVTIPALMTLPVHVHAKSVKSPSVVPPFLQTEPPESSENLAKKLKPSQKEEVEEEQQKEEKEIMDGVEHTRREEELSILSVPYVLTSVVMHSGMSSESGHYYSYGRDISGVDMAQHTAEQFVRKEDSGNGRVEACSSVSTVSEKEQGDKQINRVQEADWLLFNDSRVTFTSFQSVQNITNRFPKDTAYVLLYRKQDLQGQNENGGLMANGMSAEPPLHKELLDAIIKDNKLYLQVSEGGQKQHLVRLVVHTAVHVHRTNRKTPAGCFISE